MADTTSAPLPVTLDGSLSGASLRGAATIAVHDDAVVLRGEFGETVVPLANLEGMGYHDGRLALYLRGGDVMEATGSARLAALAREIVTQICTLPELTRPLRALGSRRGRLGTGHDRFFAPLLAARRRGERASDRQGRLRAIRPAWRPEGERLHRAELVRQLLLALGGKDIGPARDRTKALAAEHQHAELLDLLAEEEPKRPRLLRFANSRG